MDAPYAPALAGAFCFASEVRNSKLKKIKKKWEILKLGLDTGGGYVMIGTQRKGPSFEPVLG
ncbi:hypothetical protein, partial [Faecalibacterium sp. An58]|uniref:hypothetical protein n=1 Tax=Faecalibacterium sp. An58 TaxID=1965648 RepID=UPI0019518735